MSAQPQTLLDKLWSQHVVKPLSAAEDLIHVDRFFLHDLSGTDRHSRFAPARL